MTLPPMVQSGMVITGTITGTITNGKITNGTITTTTTPPPVAFTKFDDYYCKTGYFTGCGRFAHVKACSLDYFNAGTVNECKAACDEDTEGCDGFSYLNSSNHCVKCMDPDTTDIVTVANDPAKQNLKDPLYKIYYGYTWTTWVKR